MHGSQEDGFEEIRHEIKMLEVHFTLFTVYVTFVLRNARTPTSCATTVHLLVLRIFG